MADKQKVEICRILPLRSLRRGVYTNGLGG